eukprot:6203679-Pleurochrysis_carterae.AAC.1
MPTLKPTLLLTLFQADNGHIAGPANAAERLENPPFNPITSSTRTAAQVAEELREEHSSRRADTAQNPSLHAPIHQSDYLLLCLSSVSGSSGLALHRVRHGIFLYQDTDADVTFTTCEYSHMPHPSLPGLWGTFSPSTNANYDRTNVRFGTKFIRHAAASRRDQVQLSTLLPSEYPLPATIPPTHFGGAQTAQHRARSSTSTRAGTAGATDSSDEDTDTPSAEGGAQAGAGVQPD